MNANIKHFLIVCGIAFGIALLTELFEAVRKKEFNVNKVVYNLYVRLFCGAITAYFTFYIINKDIGIMGLYIVSSFGAFIGSPILSFIMKKNFNNEDEPEPKKEPDKSLIRGDFNHLMKMIGIIDDEESDAILEEQRKQKQLYAEGKIDHVMRVGDIYISRQKTNADKLFANGVVDLVLQLQQTRDFDSALSKLYELKKLKGGT